MAQHNGHFIPAVCPFSGESVQMNGSEAKTAETAKPPLRVKVAQPIELLNHVDERENFDTLHSHIDKVSSSFVSSVKLYFLYYPFRTFNSQNLAKILLPSNI